MDKNRKIQTFLLVILIIGIGIFSFLMYSWNFAYSVGTFTNEDGTYTGEFKGKLFHGKGTFKSALGPVYEGEWKDGYMEGQGRMTFVNGSYYEGGFKNGYMHGKGKMVSEDGSVLEGEWDSGENKNTIDGLGHELEHEQEPKQ